MSTFQVIDWGLRDYSEALTAQRELREQRANGNIGDTLVLTQHPPVMTIGRSGSHDNITVSKEQLRSHGIKIVEVERGGDITYHGPGQLVAYPVFHLPPARRDVKAFIRSIEQVVVDTCRDSGASAVTIEGLTGVWISHRQTAPCHLPEWSGEKKISSIGLAFKRWTCYHGVALNVDMDLTPFSYIHLCGLQGKEATSLSKTLGRKIDIEEVKQAFVKHMRRMWRKFSAGE